MIFVIHQSQNVAVWLQRRLQQRWQVFYQKLMRRLKKLTQKNLVQFIFRCNRIITRLLKVVMRSVHVVEKTWLFRLFGRMSRLALRSVHKDGLKLTGLLTAVGYLGWCLTCI